LSFWFSANGTIDFLDGFIDVGCGDIAIMSLKRAARVEQQVTRFSEHLVGFPLTLVFAGVAFESHVQGFAGGFDVFKGLGAVAFVIVIGMFDQGVRVYEFLTRWFSVKAPGEGQCHCGDY